MTQRVDCANGSNRVRAVAAALAAVRRGDVIVVPTEHVYAFAVDAFSRRGVAALRELKAYDARSPLPVMVGARSTLQGIAARVTPSAAALAEAFWPGLLTLLLQPQPSLSWDLPDDAPLAVRMPVHPFALALLAATGPLAVTTASLPGLQPPTDPTDALDQAGSAVALLLDAGPLDPRPLAGDDVDGASASTVVDTTGDVPVIVRAGAVTAADLRRVCPAVHDGTVTSGA